MFTEIRDGRKKKKLSCKKYIHFLQRALSLMKMDLHYSLKYRCRKRSGRVIRNPCKWGKDYLGLDVVIVDLKDAIFLIGQEFSCKIFFAFCIIFESPVKATVSRKTHIKTFAYTCIYMYLHKYVYLHISIQLHIKLYLQNYTFAHAYNYTYRYRGLYMYIHNFMKFIDTLQSVDC